MKNILIVAIDPSEELVTLAPLVNSLKFNNPQANISLLTDSENDTQAASIKNLDNCHLINIEQIKTILTKPVFNDITAIETMYRQLNDVRKVSWDLVISAESNALSKYIASSIRSKEYIGNITRERSLYNHSPLSQKALIIERTWDQQSINPIDVIMAENHFRKVGGVPLTFSPKMSELVERMLGNIESSREQEVYFIGFNISTIKDCNSALIKIYAETIQQLLKGTAYCPIILTSKQNQQEKVLSILNELIGKKVYTIEFSDENFTSIATSFNTIVTEEGISSQKSLLTQTNTISIRSNEKKTERYTANNANFTSVYSNLDLKKPFAPICAKNLIQLISMSEGHLKAADAKNLQHLAVVINYHEDDKRELYSLNSNSKKQLNQLANEIYLGVKTPNDINQKIRNFSAEDINQWKSNSLNKTRILSDAMKRLQRKIRKYKESKEQAAIVDIFNNVDEILQINSKDCHLSIAIQLFEEGINSIRHRSFAIMTIESELRNLKDELRKCVDITSNIATNIDSRKTTLPQHI